MDSKLLTGLDHSKKSLKISLEGIVLGSSQTNEAFLWFCANYIICAFCPITTYFYYVNNISLHDCLSIYYSV